MQQCLMLKELLGIKRRESISQIMGVEANNKVERTLIGKTLYQETRVK